MSIKKKLDRNFFGRDTLIVAKDLIGKYLVRNINGKIIVGKIIETEAYCGPNDLACHASRGRTPRTEIMFGQAGRAYIYLIYGMYHCLNIVTEKEDYPAAVLIRGIEVESIKYQVLGIKKKSKIPNIKYLIPNTKIDGPGKLCRELKIDKRLNGEDLIISRKLWLEDRGERVRNVKKTKRIGVEYAKEYKDKLWRFTL